MKKPTSSSSTTKNTNIGGGWLRGYGPYVIAMLTTLFASVFTFKNLQRITGQREVLIAIFTVLLVYINIVRASIVYIFCYDESIDYYKLLIENVQYEFNRRGGGVGEEDGDYDSDNDDDIAYYVKKYYIDDNNEISIRVGKNEVIHPNKTPHPVKTSLVSLCDFITSVFVIVIIAILIESFFAIWDNTVNSYWYNYVVIFSVPFFLLFVFIVFKHF
jgi:hypothetical protein